MTTPIVYVFCDQNCKFEGMTKEQILTAIMQAVNEGTIGDIDAGFITTIKTINGTPLKFFYGEQAAYDALTDEEKENLFPIIVNDTEKEMLINAIKDLQTATKENANAIEASKKFGLIYSLEIDNDYGREDVTIDLTQLTPNTVYLVELLNTYTYSGTDAPPLEAGSGQLIYREGMGGSITFGDVHFAFDETGTGNFYSCQASGSLGSSTMTVIGIIGTLNFYKMGVDRITEIESQSASVDLSAYESSGQIVETYEDGTKKTTSVEFDENGNPIKITDSNGNETVLTW